VNSSPAGRSGSPDPHSARPPPAATPADPGAELRARLRAIAKDNLRCGHRKAHAVLRAEGWLINHKKIQRLWREEGLRVPVRRRRKKTKNRHAGSAPVAAAPNNMWAIDFCFDATTDGRAIKITNIVDEHTRESLDGPIDRSVDADKHVDHLDKLAAVRCFPRYLCCDNGPELISNALADWAKDRTEKEKTTITFIEPGAP
jgi:putative transposase